MSFYTLKKPIGRKTYTCQWCAETIPAGEQHSHSRGYNDNCDGFFDCRMHTECEEAFSEIDYEEWTPGAYKRGSTEER